PFEKLVEALQPGRSMSYSPLFQVMFVLQNTPGEALSLEGLSVERFYQGRQQGQGVAKFDLTLNVVEQKEGLSAQLSYNTDLFEASTIERMAVHFEGLLAGIVAEPGCRVSHLPLLSERERQQLLVQWNDTGADFPQDRCLHELFEAQVARTPDAIALELDAQQLSYRELNERANQLAHHLIGSTVEPGQMVGICLERSFEMIVSILAVLKAGGVYIPLDPYLPAARLEFMVNDSGCALLLTQTEWQSALSGTAARQWHVDTLADRLDVQARTNPSLALSSTDLAYIIYTSGSTGVPKGAMITHRNLGNYFHWRQLSGLISSTDRVLQKTTLSFDVASSEIFAPLLTGATVVMAPPDRHHDLDALNRLVIDQGITQLHVPPSLLRLLVEQAEFVRDNRLIRLFSGGEEMSVSLRNRTMEQLSVRFLNGYGPTETTISVLFHDCRQSDPEQTVPIGRPIANTRIYILDKHRQMVPAGHMGELYIGGECVGAGYLNRAELSAERFVDNPFGSGRLYRSGDLVRYLPTDNGSPPDVEFLGRTDNQVKVRGFRVELGEIEAALDKHAAVVESAVIYQDEPEFQRLVAYIVVREEVAASALREFLSRALPEYMVPAVYVNLDAFPLMHNGKVDRSALPRAESIHRVSVEEYQTPESDTEKSLARIWCTLLEVERVGRQDNFFELGGHSLLAVKAISRINEEYSIQIPLRSIFEHPTLEKYAEAIDNLNWVFGQSAPSENVYGEEGEL
ncbi:MAG: amino acid adenylation domain-containing protein, partial [Rhodothermales bacterium]|nr:amino acid adenylation domain-containing protein [Rhodothermales bacterium]